VTFVQAPVTDSASPAPSLPDQQVLSRQGVRGHRQKMMLRWKLPKVLCTGLTLVIAVNLLLAFSTKRPFQGLILGSHQRELRSSLSEWDEAMAKRLSHLEEDVQHLSKCSTLMWRRDMHVCACEWA
jgi:hypothetical protein